MLVVVNFLLLLQLISFINTFMKGLCKINNYNLNIDN